MNIILLLLSNLHSFYSYGYNENIGIYSVNLAQSAYSVSDINDWNCKTCNPSIILTDIVENKGVKAIQGYDKYTDCIFTSFRGSSNMMNWIHNIQIRPITPYINTKIEVSNGFYKDYTYVKSELLYNLLILKREYNTSNILLTGHSLGGALATLMAFDILNEFQNYNLKYLITYGSPRVGNIFFAINMNNHNYISYRIIHHKDIVPQWPKTIMGYLHINTGILYNNDNSNYYLCSDNYTIKINCFYCWIGECTNITDHLYYLNVSMGNI